MESMIRFQPFTNILILTDHTTGYLGQLVDKCTINVRTKEMTQCDNISNFVNVLPVSSAIVKWGATNKISWSGRFIFR